MKDTLRVVGVILLGLFVLLVGVPLVLAAAGIALHGIGLVIAIVVGAVKLAVVLAVIYLILVGVRAAMNRSR